MRRVLVTGASGFVGGHLCHILRREGIQVLALSRTPQPGPWEEVVAADLGAEASLPERLMTGVDAVFHLAGRGDALAERMGNGAAEHWQINVGGTRKLVEAARRAGVTRFLFISSVKAMGEGGKRELDEDDANPPVTPYGRSKLEAERVVLEAGFPYACVLRPPLVYGPGGEGNLKRMIEWIRRGILPPLPRVANRRSMIHVADLASAALLAMRRPEAAGRVYIVTDGGAYATWEIQDWILDALGRRPPRWRTPLWPWRVIARVGDGLGTMIGRHPPIDSEQLDKLMGSAWYSAARIRRELGFVNLWTLRQALPEMVQRSAGGERG